MKENIPYYVINEPYELFYKNDISSYPVGAHTHNKAEIYLTLSDLPDALINDTVSSIPKNTLIAIPPFCVHQLFHEKDVRYERYILNLDPVWLEDVLYSKQEFTECLKQSSSPLVMTLTKEQVDILTINMQAVLPVLSQKSLCSTATLLNMLAILDSIIQDSRYKVTHPTITITKSQKTVNEIIAFINEHIEDNLSLPDIEAHFFLNRDYLSRLFAKHTHTSLGRYISIQRIAKAQEYLREGYTVLQVSEILGFSSYAYFFKVFQKMTGISPSQYRNNFFI